MTKRLIEQANKSARNVRYKLESKHSKKIEFLVSKYKKETFKLPDDIKKFQDMKIFQQLEDTEAKKKSIEGEPMVIDCTVNDDEKRVLLLLPKFAIMEKLNQTKFNIESEYMKPKA